MTKPPPHHPEDAPDLTETKIHVLRAGRELLLAAEGALNFCWNYVCRSDKEPDNPELLRFFSRALDVVRELGGDLKPEKTFDDLINENIRNEDPSRTTAKKRRRKQRNPK